MTGRGLTSFLLLIAICAGASGTANAQTAVGLRAGVSADPDQGFVGVHFDTRPLIDNLTFRPSFEVGFGDDVTLAAINFEFAYWIPIEQTSWRLYLGGGPAINIYAFDGDSAVEGGFNIIVGLQHRRGLFTELKVGAMDSPDLKFAIGYAFGR